MVVNEKKYAVIYSDGSARPNPGFSGSGIHGYIYTDKELGVKTGNKPNHYTLTDNGYLRNDELNKIPHQIVSPTHYIDWAFPGEKVGTNNTAEVSAIIVGLRELNKLGVTNILLKADSMYALNILYKLLNPEIEVSKILENVTVNQKYWIELNDVLQVLFKNNVEIEARHVKAHTDNLGNNMADKLALLGRTGSSRFFHAIDQFPFKDDFTLTEAKQYWKPKSDRHDLLSQRQMYFTNLDVPDETGGMWYTMLKYSEDRELGKKTNDAAFSIVYLPEPDEKIAELLEIYKMNTMDKVSVATLRIDELYRPNMLRLYNRFGKYLYLYNRARNRHEITPLEDGVLVNELYPQGLAFSAMDNTQTLHNVYSDYKNKTTNASKIFIDITDQFYDDTDKGLVFKKDLNTNNTGIDITYMLGDKEIKIPIQFGLDIMPKNNLRRVGKKKPKIILAIRNNNNVRLDYYTIVELEDTGEVVVTTNYFSNSVFVDAIKKRRKK